MAAHMKFPYSRFDTPTFPLHLDLQETFTSARVIVRDPPRDQLPAGPEHFYKDSAFLVVSIGLKQLYIFRRKSPSKLYGPPPSFTHNA